MSRGRTVLVTGGAGMLGHLLVTRLRDHNRVLYTTHRDGILIPGAEALAWDLATGARQLDRLDAVIHTAALTNVDYCQQHPDQAHQVNVLATRNVVASAPGAHVIYISTDFVFDGSRGGYTEGDVPSPQTSYGKTKLDGETEVPQDGCVIRTSIYGLGSGPQRPGLIEKIVSRLRSGEAVTGFTDQSFTPIATANLSQFIEEILERRYAGTVHIGSDRPCTKFEFMQEIAIGFGFDRGLVRPGVSSAVAYLAPRPRDASLDCSKARRDFSTTAWTLERSMLDISQQMEERGWT